MKTNFSPFGGLIFLISFTEQTIAQQDLCPPWALDALANRRILKSTVVEIFHYFILVSV